MRNKDLKNLMRQKASEVEIKDFTNEIINKVDHKAIVEEKKHKPKALFYSLGGLTLASLFIVVFLFLFRPGVTPAPPTPGVVTLAKKEMVLSKEAVALGNAIESIGSADSTLSLMGYMTYSSDDDEDDDIDTPTLTKEEYKAIAIEMNTYLYAADSFINKDNLKVNVIENSDSDFKFDFKMTITMTDTNFSKEYILYYTESKSGSEVSITGVILIDEDSYRVEGEREDDGEECELELKLITSKTSYISIKNETEINENEFEYSFYENNKLVKSVSMEIEVENNLKEASIEIKEGNNVKGFEFEYHENYIKAEYISNEVEFEMNIEIYDTYFLYKFEDLDYDLRLDK